MMPAVHKEIQGWGGPIQWGARASSCHKHKTLPFQLPSHGSIVSVLERLGRCIDKLAAALAVYFVSHPLTYHSET